MAKTQVQIPDHLHQEAKRIAAETARSFAQVVRMGLESIVRQYPAGRPGSGEWGVPAALVLGEALVPKEERSALRHE